MITHDDLDPRLSNLLDEIAAARTPDYLDEVRANARQHRQRPAWSFPGRWIPVDLALSPPRSFPTFAWLVIVALIVIAVAMIAVIGSQPRVPPPFGPAANGVVVTDDGSHIIAVDADGTDRRSLTSGTSKDTLPSLSLDGRRLAFMRQSGESHSLVVADADGRQERVLLSPTTAEGDIKQEAPAWSPDGRQIAFGVMVPGKTGPHAEIWIANVDGSGYAKVLPAGLVSAEGPVWAPDGRRIAFLGEPDPNKSDGYLYVAAPDGSDPLKLSDRASSPTTGFLGSPRWSPDGTRIALDQGTIRRDVIVLATDHAEELLPMGGAADEADPAWSPDGTKLAFVRSTGAGAPYEVVVRDLTTGKQETLGPAGVYASRIQWSPDGSRIGALHCVTETNCELWLLDATGGDQAPIVVPVSTKNIEASNEKAYWSWQRLAR